MRRRAALALAVTAAAVWAAPALAQDRAEACIGEECGEVPLEAGLTDASFATASGLCRVVAEAGLSRQDGLRLCIEQEVYGGSALDVFYLPGVAEVSTLSDHRGRVLTAGLFR